MLGLLLLVGAGGTALVAARARPLAALWLLVLTVLLVPGTLPVPGAPGVLTVHRLVVLAVGAGLALRCRRRELPRQLWRPPSLAYRFLLVVGLLAFLGVGLLQPRTDPSVAARNWQDLALQLVFFVVWVVLLRAVDNPFQALLVLAVAMTLSAAIAVLERVTGESYARLWFHAVPRLLGSDQAQVLAERGGQVRVRAAGDFTLGFAWMTAAAVPVVLALAAMRRRAQPLLLGVCLPLLLAAVVLTFARSAVLPVAAVVLLVAAVVRDKGIRLAAAAMLVIGLLAVLSSPTLEHQFTAAVDQGSIDVRAERLPVVGSLVAAHPYVGLGIGGLAAQGIPATDSSYLLSYAEVGVIGLAAFVGLLVMALAGAAGGLRSRDRVERLGALGALLGALLICLGTFTFDAFSTPTVVEVFWLLIACGVVAQDGVAARARALSLRTRAVLVAAAALVGLGLRLTAPTHVAQTFQYETLAPYPATVAAPTFTGTQLRATFCALVRASLVHTTMTCQAAGEAPGQGILRLEARDAAALETTTQRALDAAHAARPLSRVRLLSRGPATEGTATGLRTAHVWLPVLAAVCLLPVPGRRRGPASDDL